MYSLPNLMNFLIEHIQLFKGVYCVGTVQRACFSNVLAVENTQVVVHLVYFLHYMKEVTGWHGM